jgi:phosphatidylserine/phosphatidylglycerophosphate/cardiolipin synthase-like enzyme
MEGKMASHALWAHHGTYPLRQGNEVDILIDGKKAYSEIAAAFYNAKEFIYLTISFGEQDFLLVPETGEKMFDILKSRQKEGIDVRMVVWQPALHTPDTIPDPTPANIPGVNEGTISSIQARWDKAPGFKGRYTSVLSLFDPKDLAFTAEFGCHHQKTYIMDDGGGGVMAFVGGINPVQAYWDTPDHDSLDVRRVEIGKDLLKGLEENPPLHDVFYRIKGPAVADVLANFVERYNGATIPYKDVTSDAVLSVTADKIPKEPNGIEVQVVRTIAPHTYQAIPDGDKGIREVYLNALSAAEKGSLVYIENQYFYDHGIICKIHEAAERGAKIIALLTWKPDEGTFLGRVEKEWERISHLEDQSKMVEGHDNVALLTLGNSRLRPRDPDKIINSETYIHSKNMAVIGDYWAIMTGGSANIAFTSMWFHSEMNIVFTDIARIKDWVAQLWSEHLQIPEKQALGLIEKPDDALTFFKAQATDNMAALKEGQRPKGRVYDWKRADFPKRDFDGIILPVPQTV